MNWPKNVQRDEKRMKKKEEDEKTRMLSTWPVFFILLFVLLIVFDILNFHQGLSLRDRAQTVPFKKLLLRACQHQMVQLLM